jgi:hypothetical protein
MSNNNSDDGNGSGRGDGRGGDHGTRQPDPTSTSTSTSTMPTPTQTLKLFGDILRMKTSNINSKYAKERMIGIRGNASHFLNECRGRQVGTGDRGSELCGTAVRSRLLAGSPRRLRPRSARLNSSVLHECLAPWGIILCVWTPA